VSSPGDEGNAKEDGLQKKERPSKAVPGASYSLFLPRVGSSTSINGLEITENEEFENEAPSTASSHILDGANDVELSAGQYSQTPVTPSNGNAVHDPRPPPRHEHQHQHPLPLPLPPHCAKPSKATDSEMDSEHKSRPLRCPEMWSIHAVHGDEADSDHSVDSVQRWLSERNHLSAPDTAEDTAEAAATGASAFDTQCDVGRKEENNGLEAVSKESESNDNSPDGDNDGAASASTHHLGIMQSVQSLVQSPRFMDSAIAIYSQLDDSLSNLQQLKEQQLGQMRSLHRRRKQRMRHHHGGGEGESKEDDLRVNEHLSGVLQTLISSTTEMGSLLRPHTVHSEESGQSLIGGLFERLSASIGYISYLSVSALTPFLYKIVEAVLVELYATIRDVIEYYDPDPKNNILWRIIQKMNDVIEAVQGLMALSDCFYEIASEELESEPDADHGGGGGGGTKQKTL